MNPRWVRRLALALVLILIGWGFCLRRGREKISPPPVSPVPTAPVQALPRIALVYDDVGYGHRRSLERALRIKAKQTFAVIPFSERDQFFSKLIREAGGELMVHLPMPSEEAHPSQQYPGGVFMKDTPEEVEDRIAKGLERIQGAAGLNNHQGSLGTADERLMGLVLASVQKHGLYFLDSRTTTKTKAPELAAKMGVRFAERGVFLDNVEEAGAIRASLDKLVRKARKNGSAVGIGHLRDMTVEVLESEIPKIQASGIELVWVSQIVAVPAGTP